MHVGTLLLAGERVAERVEACDQQGAISGDPGIQLLKWLRPQRLQTPWAVGPHPHEPGFLQDAEVSRHA